MSEILEITPEISHKDSYSHLNYNKKEKNDEWKKPFYRIDYRPTVFDKPRTLNINLYGSVIIKLHERFSEIAREIENSKAILKFSDNWDDEGSCSYKKDTFKQAVEFLSKYANWIWEETKSMIIDTPKILPGINGSIDLFWEKENYDLIINIPPHPKSIAKFYGDDKKFTKIKGEFPVNSYNQGIFLCLLNK